MEGRTGAGALLLPLGVPRDKGRCSETVQPPPRLEALPATFWKPFVPTPRRLTSQKAAHRVTGLGEQAGATPSASRPQACEASPAGPSQSRQETGPPSLTLLVRHYRHLRRRSPRGPRAARWRRGDAGLAGLQVGDLVFHGRCDLLQPVAQLHLLGRAIFLQSRDDLVIVFVDILVEFM